VSVQTEKRPKGEKSPPGVRERAGPGRRLRGLKKEGGQKKEAPYYRKADGEGGWARKRTPILREADFVLGAVTV